MDGGPSRQGWLRPVLVGGQQALQELGGGAVQGLDEVHAAVNSLGATRSLNRCPWATRT